MPAPQNLVKNACDIEHGDWGLVPYAGNEQQNVRLGSGSSQTSQSCSSGDICRICHCESDTLNPLLAPCYCSGSLKYVHQTCLQQWLTASETRSCELCKFPFIMHTKIKPFNEWRRLEMSGVERRRLCCAVLFHCVAALCVIWSLFVLIDRAAEEVQRGLIAWPFWTKLVVVAVGFTGGAVFMYIQCRQYLQLCNRWRSHNRILLIQNAPEKVHILPPSPVLGKNINQVSARPVGGASIASQRLVLGQVVANIENNPLNQQNNECSTESNGEIESDSRSSKIQADRTTYNVDANSTTSVFLENQDILGGGTDCGMSKCSHRHSTAFLVNKSVSQNPSSSSASRRYSDTKLLQNFNITNYLGAGVEDLGCQNFDIENNDAIEKCPAEGEHSRINFTNETMKDTLGCTSNADLLELTIKQILDLDVKSQHNMRSVLSLDNKSKDTYDRSSAVFKSLPNLSASSENLLP